MNSLENRSLDRGISVLEVMARSGSTTLADLNRESGIPKSTIRRLLGTLQKRHLVRRSLADKKYRININLPLGIGEPVSMENAMLVDVVMPVLIALTKEVLWPSDFQLVEDSYMRIMDSTRIISPFHLHRGIVNRCLNIFGSATGHVCLANMSNERIIRLLETTRNDKVWGLKRFNITNETYLSKIEETRKLGYGVRLAECLGETPIDDKLAAIAVPVFIDSEPIGAINLLFPRKFQNPHKFAEEYLEKLQQAATQISADLGARP